MNKTTTTRPRLTLPFNIVAAACLGLSSIATMGTARSAEPDWPAKPIRIIVNLAPGGGTDVVARQLAVPLGKALGQPVIVENKVGAGGNVGADQVAKSRPDGYTFLMTAPSPIAQAMVVYKKLPYNPQTDLMVVNDIAVPRVVCAVHPSVPAKNVAELFAWAKANPNKLTMGSWGVGTQSQAAQVVFDKVYGTKTISVNYRGESQAVGDLLGGQILMSCATTQALKGHIEKSSLRAIATLGETRSVALPDVPTFAESGYKDEVLNFTAPISLVAPTGTPKSIIDRIGAEVSKIVKSEEMQKQITSIGFEPVGNTPDEALAAYNARLPILLRSVRDIGITID